MNRSLLMPYVLAALSLPMGFAVKAAPVVLASPQLYGGQNEAEAVCYVFNTGAGKASITSFGIIDQNGTSLALSLSTCATTLAAGATCVFTTYFNADFSHSCVVNLPKKDATIRASVEIRDSNNSVLNFRDLH